MKFTLQMTVAFDDPDIETPEQVINELVPAMQSDTPEVRVMEMSVTDEQQNQFYRYVRGLNE